MTITPPGAPYGTAIFCDQIRVENNGKLLLIGAYNNLMVFPAPFPQKIPGMAIYITYVEPAALPPAEVMLRIMITDGSGDRILSEIAAGARPQNNDVPEPIFYTAYISTTLGEITFESAGRFTIHVERHGQQYAIGELSFIAHEAPPPA